MKPYNELLENNPHINQIYSIPFNKRKWIKAFCLIPCLRKQKYDLIIDIPTKPTIKRLFYFYLINAKNVMSTNSDGVKLVNYNICWNRNAHLSEIFVKALNFFGLQNVDKKYELFISQKDEKFVNDFILKNKLMNKRIFVFNPKASTLSRTLNKDNIKKILILLQKYDYSIVLLDYEEEYEEFKDISILYTSNNIMQVAALVKQSDYVLTTDTGIVHIADIYLKPMTILYSDVFKEGEKSRDNSYIVEWGSINPKTKMLRDKYNVNNISIDNIITILDREIK